MSDTGNLFYGSSTPATAPPGDSTPGSSFTFQQTTTEAPPGAASSAYQYQTYVAGASNVVLGPVLANLMGLDPTKGYQGDYLMSVYQQLPTDTLKQIQTYLNDAGMYVNANNESLQGQPQLGTLDNNAFVAFSNAILRTANAGKGQTMSGLLTQAITSGAGLATIQAGLSPISGGGGTYQVNLTSPQDMYSTAMATFQSLLGRNPTQSELSEMTSQLHSQETSYQQGQNTQQEQMKQTEYQSAINARNAENQPNITTGNVPNGPFTDPTQWAVALLEYMAPSQITPQAVAFLTNWIGQNGGLNGKGKFDPLGVQTNAPGSAASPQGAQSFSSWAQGIQAAANLLSSPQYAELLDGILGAGTNKSADFNTQMNQQLQGWSGGAIKQVKPTAAQSKAAATAVSQYVTPASPVSIGEMTQQDARAHYRGANPGDVAQQPQGAPTPVPGAPPSQTSISPQQLNPGQGLSSPGDTYIAPTTLTDVTPPSASSVATVDATTGANAVPYLGNQFLNAYKTIAGMIHPESAPI